MQDLGIISPSLDEFRKLAGHSRVIPVRLKVLADAETPIGLYRKLAHGQPGTFLLESAAVGGAWSRYSFIGARSRLAGFPTQRRRFATDHENVVVAIAVNVLAAKGAWFLRARSARVYGCRGPARGVASEPCERMF